VTPILQSWASAIRWGGHCSLVCFHDLVHVGSRGFPLLFSFRCGSADFPFHPSAGAGHGGAVLFFLEPLYVHFFHEGFHGHQFRIVFSAPQSGIASRTTRFSAGICWCLPGGGTDMSPFSNSPPAPSKCARCASLSSITWMNSIFRVC